MSHVLANHVHDEERFHLETTWANFFHAARIHSIALSRSGRTILKITLQHLLAKPTGKSETPIDVVISSSDGCIELMPIAHAIRTLSTKTRAAHFIIKTLGAWLARKPPDYCYVRKYIDKNHKTLTFASIRQP